jgi:hypothetical protein
VDVAARAPARATTLSAPGQDQQPSASEPPPDAATDVAEEDAGEETQLERESTRPAPAEAGLVVGRDGAARGGSDSGGRSGATTPAEAVDTTRAAASLGGVVSGQTTTADGAASASSTTGAQTASSRPDSAGAAPTGVRVRMVVPAPIASIGQTVAVRVMIEGAAGVGSVPFNLEFNRAVLQFDRGTQGAFLGGDGWNVVFMVAPASAGNVVVVGLSRLGENEGIGGAGELCTIYFKVIGAGAANLRFANGSVRDGRNNVIAGSFDNTTLTAR